MPGDLCDCTSFCSCGGGCSCGAIPHDDLCDAPGIEQERQEEYDQVVEDARDRAADQFLGEIKDGDRPDHSLARMRGRR